MTAVWILLAALLVVLLAGLGCHSRIWRILPC